MKRLISFAILAAIGAVAYVEYGPIESTVTVTDAQAVPIGTNGSMFMVSMRMQNDGPAVTLTEVRSPVGAGVLIMNPGYADAPLVIPANSEGLLAMDGAHIMLSIAGDTFSEGTFQSISLGFDDGSEVVTRVIHAGQGAMQHDNAIGVEEDLAPSVEIIPPETISADGFDVILAVDNFDFVMAADDASHQPNQGHAHIYLNGLKLGRMYEDRFRVGALTPGEYRLRVGLNTNDHRPYEVSGSTVEATLQFRIGNAQ